MENNDSKLTNKQEAENIIKAGLELIPCVGGSLATLYFDKKQQKEFNRLSNFYKELSEELKSLKEEFSLDGQDKAKLMTLIEKINDKVEKEVLREKIDCFKKFFKNILIEPIKDDYDEKVFFLESLSSMTLLEMGVLRFLNSQNNFVAIGSIQKEGIEQYAIVGAVGRLRNLGFLQSAGGGMSFGDMSDNYLKELVKISAFGEKFIKFCLSI